MVCDGDGGIGIGDEIDGWVIFPQHPPLQDHFHRGCGSGFCNLSIIKFGRRWRWMAPLRCLFDRAIELRLSRFVGIEETFQKAARSRFKAFSIYFPPPLTLLGFEPAQ